MHSVYILLGLVLFAVTYGVTEFLRHQRVVSTIAIRVHVNGTRGKSSLARLIGAGLRAGGIKTITKVTGTYPRMVLEDGTEISIPRKGDPNIIEQLNIIRFAAEREAEAVVVECMALEPQYQWITEHQMIRSTVGVITNVRLDHTDVMGKTRDQIARSLSNTIPSGQVLFTSEHCFPPIMTEVADARSTSICVAPVETVGDEEMRGFSYLEHKENVALALAVCHHLGIDRKTALHGMHRSRPDPGALRRFTMVLPGKRLIFYNAFAANDPDSTAALWARLQVWDGLEGKRIVLFNIRDDRMERAEQLVVLLGGDLKNEFDYVLLIGRCTNIVRRMLAARGINAAQILNLGWSTPQKIVENVVALTNGVSTIVGIGNMGGLGRTVVSYFEERSCIQYD